MAYLLIGAGGALGSLARYGAGRIIQQRSNSAFPLGTLLVNLLGPLLLGLVISLNLPQLWYLLLANGFLGAFTTFSTFMYEEITLFAGNEKKNAIVYIAVTLLLGIAAFFAGYALGGLLVKPI